MASVTFTIPDSKLPEFREAFLEVHPVPRDPATLNPLMTENAWIKEWGKRMYYAVYKSGRKRVRDKAHPATHDSEVIG